MKTGERFRIAVEDRFVVLNLVEDENTLPEGMLLEELVHTLASVTTDYSVVCDLRGIDAVTSDVADLVSVLSDYGDFHLLCTSDDLEVFTDSIDKPVSKLLVHPGALPLNFAEIDIMAFDRHLIPGETLSQYDVLGSAWQPTLDEWEFLKSVGDSFAETYEDFVESWYTAQSNNSFRHSSEFGRFFFARRSLQRTMASVSRNSLLSEFAIQAAADSVTVTPYHAHAVHSIEAKGELLIARPGVVAARTASLFRNEIDEFEYLLGGSNTQERHIQKFLEAHPSFLRGLGYQNVYAQVVLERTDGTSLRPDFILEPMGTQWCDILDLKLPDVRTVVGSRDRKDWSSVIHALMAQLREYSAYFEDERLAKRIEDVYGIKCYRPRLIGVVGREPNTTDERQLRRMRSMYQDVDVLSFDRLLSIAKSRLLI